MAVRPGTGKIVKFFLNKENGDTTAKLAKECDNLTDQDIKDLSEGIENGTLTY